MDAARAEPVDVEPELENAGLAGPVDDALAGPVDGALADDVVAAAVAIAAVAVGDSNDQMVDLAEPVERERLRPADEQVAGIGE